MELRNKIEEINASISATPVVTKEEVEIYRIKFLGSKGLIKDLYELLKSVPNESKKGR